MSRFQFVDDHRGVYGVARLCEIVEVARSSFYAWLAAARTRRARSAADAALAATIRALQDPAQGGDRAYGAPRITADLNDGVGAGERVNRKRVARVMRQHQLAGIRLRRRVKTTIPSPATGGSSRICSDASSGSGNRAAVTSATSLTCPSPTALTSTWPL